MKQYGYMCCFLLQILLDGSGILKYSDFGLSKVEGENLEELFEKFAEAGGGEEDSITPRKYKTQGKSRI